MAKYELRIKARALRQKGISVKNIAQSLNASKSTVSMWVRDISLSVEYVEKLKEASLKGAEVGRARALIIRRENRIALLEHVKEAGRGLLEGITERELLIAGLALYWDEGGKTSRRVEFCNSDPKMVKFLIRWFEKCFQIQQDDFTCTVGINEVHRDRDALIKTYWSEITDIPLEQFTKTSFKKVNNKKVYENFNEYFGVLTVRVRRSTAIHYKIMGLIDGLYVNLPK